MAARDCSSLAFNGDPSSFSSACSRGPSEDLKVRLGLSEGAVYRALKANNLVKDKQLPTLEELQQFFWHTDYQIYDASVPEAMDLCSKFFSLSQKALRNQFQEVSFDPKHPWSLDEVCKMLKEVKKSGHGLMNGA